MSSGGSAEYLLTGGAGSGRALVEGTFGSPLLFSMSAPCVTIPPPGIPDAPRMNPKSSRWRQSQTVLHHTLGSVGRGHYAYHLISLCIRWREELEAFRYVDRAKVSARVIENVHQYFILPAGTVVSISALSRRIGATLDSSPDPGSDNPDPSIEVCEEASECRLDIGDIRAVPVPVTSKRAEEDE